MLACLISGCPFYGQRKVNGFELWRYFAPSVMVRPRSNFVTMDSLPRASCRTSLGRIPRAPGTGAALDAAHGALQRRRQPPFRLAENDFGEWPPAVAFRQLGGTRLDVGRDRAGVPGQLQRDLLVVAGLDRVPRVGPRQHGLDQRLVRLAVERQFRLDQTLGVVQDGVGAGHEDALTCSARTE